jgi:uncharacterized membrane protein YfcA
MASHRLRPEGLVKAADGNQRQGQHWPANITLLVSLLVGSIPGIALGMVLARRTPDRLLRVLLAIALAAVGDRLVIA